MYNAPPSRGLTKKEEQSLNVGEQPGANQDRYFEPWRPERHLLMSHLWEHRHHYEQVIKPYRVRWTEFAFHLQNQGVVDNEDKPPDKNACRMAWARTRKRILAEKEVQNRQLKGSKLEQAALGPDTQAPRLDYAPGHVTPPLSTPTDENPSPCCPASENLSASSPNNIEEMLRRLGGVSVYLPPVSREAER